MHQGDRRQGAAGSGFGGVLGELTLAARRDCLRAAVEALVGVEGVLHQGVGAELGPFFAEMDALRRGCEAAQVATLAEALERGEVASSTWSNGGGLGAGVGAVVPFRWGG